MSVDTKTKLPSHSPASLTGFTLVELLVCVVILAVALVSTMSLQIASTRSANQAMNMTVASVLAESEIERLKTFTNFNEIEDAIPSGAEHLSREGVACVSGAPGCVFTRNTVLVSGEPTSRSHNIEVTISWSSLTGTQSLTYNAVLTDYNLGNSTI
ncbi:MAG: prepilin-type N-terminal cleavage/methylation domain-containing protein [Deltaproteobacteria bacterium]|nr:prepilin-type N-terminal cleavage/methylation domain-containing protein [Deltaproteobacteria bacterium]